MADGQHTIIDRIQARLKNRRDRLQRILEQKSQRPRGHVRREIFTKLAEPAATFRAKLAGLEQEHLEEVAKILKAAEKKSTEASPAPGRKSRE